MPDEQPENWLEEARQAWEQLSDAEIEVHLYAPQLDGIINRYRQLRYKWQKLPGTEHGDGDKAMLADVMSGTIDTLAWEMRRQLDSLGDVVDYFRAIGAPIIGARPSRLRRLKGRQQKDDTTN
jgi:hypothetical protein